MSRRTLIILRHGKAAPHDAYASDHQRPLVARGHAEAEFIGRHLRDHGPRPALVLSSPVLRALTTAQVVARHARCDIATDSRLSTDLAAAAAWDAACEALASRTCVLVAGHNPTLSALLDLLLQPGEAARAELHTGEAAVVSFVAEPKLRGAALIDRVRMPPDPHGRQ